MFLTSLCHCSARCTIVPLSCLWHNFPIVLSLTYFHHCLVFDIISPLSCLWHNLPIVLSLTYFHHCLVFDTIVSLTCIWHHCHIITLSCLWYHYHIALSLIPLSHCLLFDTNITLSCLWYHCLIALSLTPLPHCLIALSVTHLSPRSVMVSVLLICLWYQYFATRSTPLGKQRSGLADFWSSSTTEGKRGKGKAKLMLLYLRACETEHGPSLVLSAPVRLTWSLLAQALCQTVVVSGGQSWTSV